MTFHSGAHEEHPRRQHRRRPAAEDWSDGQNHIRNRPCGPLAQPTVTQFRVEAHLNRGNRIALNDGNTVGVLETLEHTVLGWRPGGYRRLQLKKCSGGGC